VVTVGRDSADWAHVSVSQGLEVEEILDLWNVAFPEAWNVYFDDETDTIHYSEQPQSVHHAD
jgi:hypothetical protein